jgi:hypothetical protein
MSTATDFLNGWVSENVNATVYQDTQMAEHLAQDCHRSAAYRKRTCWKPLVAI